MSTVNDISIVELISSLSKKDGITLDTITKKVGLLNLRLSEVGKLSVSEVNLLVRISDLYDKSISYIESSLAVIREHELILKAERELIYN